MRPLLKLTNLSRADRSLLLRVCLRLWVTSAAVRLVPFALLRRRIGRRTLAKETSFYPLDRVLWAIRTARRYTPGANCLVQALAARASLQATGHNAELRFGVSREGESTLMAHAWVESGGQVLIGGPVEQYTPLPRVQE